MRFQDKTAIVTGGASGMGAATARLLAQEGARVFIVDRNAALAENTAHEIGATVIAGDVSDSRLCDAAVHNVIEQYGHLDLCVNAVCPGEVDTPMLRAACRAIPLTDAQAQDMGERVVPMGRLARPEEIARVVLFLCSDDASYVTGAMYYADGGFSTL